MEFLSNSENSVFLSNISPSSSSEEGLKPKNVKRLFSDRDDASPFHSKATPRCEIEESYQKEEEDQVEISQESNSINSPDEDQVAETEEERLQRELEESERLAWELMREDSINTYEMQWQYMNENMEGISEEDLRALRDAVRESAQHDLSIINHQIGRMEQPNGVVDENEEDNNDQEEEEDDFNYDYEQLLALGQALGDVKTERWKKKANAFIKSIPTKLVCCIKTESKDAEIRCVICMEEFNDDDSVNVLGCSHYFHCECTSGWLQDHFVCPICKVKVTGSP